MKSLPICNGANENGWKKKKLSSVLRIFILLLLKIKRILYGFCCHRIQASSSITLISLKLKTHFFSCDSYPFECVSMHWFAFQIFKMCKARSKADEMGVSERKNTGDERRLLLFMDSWITISTEWKFRSRSGAHMLVACNAHTHTQYWLTLSWWLVRWAQAYLHVRTESVCSLSFHKVPAGRAIHAPLFNDKRIRSTEQKKKTENKMRTTLILENRRFSTAFENELGTPFDFHRCK